MTQEWISIGSIRSVNPARRELRIAPEPAHAHEFESLEWIRVAARETGPDGIRCRVTALEMLPEGGVVATLSAGVTREAIGRMKGGAVTMAPEELRDAPAADEDGVTGLVGCSVVNAAGESLGLIVDEIETGLNGAVVIAKTEGGTLILPLIEQVVMEIDLERAVMTVGDIAPYAVEENDDPAMENRSV